MNAETIKQNQHWIGTEVVAEIRGIVRGVHFPGNDVIELVVEHERGGQVIIPSTLFGLKSPVNNPVENVSISGEELANKSGNPQ